MKHFNENLLDEIMDVETQTIMLFGTPECKVCEHIIGIAEERLDNNYRLLYVDGDKYSNLMGGFGFKGLPALINLKSGDVRKVTGDIDVLAEFYNYTTKQEISETSEYIMKCVDAGISGDQNIESIGAGIRALLEGLTSKQIIEISNEIYNYDKSVFFDKYLDGFMKNRYIKDFYSSKFCYKPYYTLAFLYATEIEIKAALLRSFKPSIFSDRDFYFYSTISILDDVLNNKKLFLDVLCYIDPNFKLVQNS